MAVKTAKNVKPEELDLETQDTVDEDGESTIGAMVDNLSIRDLRAGRATFTVVTRQTGESFTYRINRGENKPEYQDKYGKYSWYVNLLTGKDNQTAYTYMGALTQDNSGMWIVKRTTASAIMSSAPSWQVMAWLLRKITRNEPYNYAKGAEVFMMGYCLRCRKPLTRKSSILNMYGEWCYGQMLQGL
ncbi:MAG: hypothetical protein ACXWQ5_01050 [Ktedonobacterales bacterium]